MTEFTEQSISSSDDSCQITLTNNSEELFYNKALYLYKNVIEEYKTNVDSSLFHPGILTYATFNNFYRFLKSNYFVRVKVTST